MRFKEHLPQFGLVVLLAANFALGAVCPFDAEYYSGFQPRPIILGVWTTQAVVLAALALAATRHHGLQVAAAVLFPLLHSYAIWSAWRWFGIFDGGQIQPPLLFFGILSALTAALLTALDWFFGLRLSCDRTTAEKVRFRLADLMRWTAIVALPFMLLRMLDFGAYLEQSVLQITAIVWLMVALPTLLLCLHQSSWGGTPIRGSLVIGCTLAAYLWTDQLDLLRYWYFGMSKNKAGTLYTAAAVTLAFNIAALRLMGYRWSVGRMARRRSQVLF